MRAKDALGNISNDTTDTIILDRIPPTVSAGYITNGLTGTDGTYTYYK